MGTLAPGGVQRLSRSREEPAGLIQQPVEAGLVPPGPSEVGPRLQDGGVESSRLLDLGFRAGAEAGLIAAARSAIPASARGALADGLRSDGGGLAAFDLALVVGGTDIGPRSWVEQVAPRPDDPQPAPSRGPGEQHHQTDPGPGAGSDQAQQQQQQLDDSNEREG